MLFLGIVIFTKLRLNKIFKKIAVFNINKGFIWGKKYTYEYIKEEINGYHHEGNADGSKFINFAKQF